MNTVVTASKSALNGNLSKILTVMIVALVTLPSWAGTKDGGGGKAVVCRDASGAIKSAELLDLYEGRVQYGVMTPASGTINEMIETSINNLGKGRGAKFTDLLRQYTRFVNATKTILPDGTGLEPIDDSFHVVIPEGCKVEQLANYTSQNHVLINGKIWAKLDDQSKAGLILHEALYKIFRTYGATNSIRARKAVAFSRSILMEDVLEHPTGTVLSCASQINSNGSPFPGTQFLAYNDDSGNLVLQFDYLEGQLMLTKSTVSVDRIPVEKLLAYDGVDTFYSISLISSLELMQGVVVGFTTESTPNGPRKKMSIGWGSEPSTPTREFFCGKI